MELSLGKRKRTEDLEKLGLTLSVEVASASSNNSNRKNNKKAIADSSVVIPEAYASSCLEFSSSGDKSTATKGHGAAQEISVKVVNGSSSNERKRDDNLSESDALLLSIASHAFQKLSQKQKSQWKPTPIQLQSWPILIGGGNKSKNLPNLNLTAIAATGSGKTLAYTIPMVHSCLQNQPTTERSSYIHGLVLLPTRELVIQVSKALKIVGKVGSKISKKKKIGNSINMVSLAIYGGIDKQEQINSLLQEREQSGSTAYLVASTPMRLIDLLAIGDDKGQGEEGEKESKSPDGNVVKLRALFGATRFLVLDEADRLAIQTDLSKQIDLIMEFLQSTSQCLDKRCLFSATLPERAIPKCNEWVNVPRVTVKVDAVTVGRTFEQLGITQQKDDEKGDQNADSNDGTKEENPNKRQRTGGQLDLSSIPSHITQILHVCANHKKPKKLLGTIKKIRDGEKKESNRRRKGLIIIFFGRIKTLQYIHQLLAKENVKGVQLHSQMNQQKREMQLNSFKSGKTPILFATDIAARGLHCNNVEYIINYDFPGSLEQYVHRCGRAGRNKISAGNGENTGGHQLNATVYSFFHRELSPIANDMIDLLRSCNAWVDPNLLSLAPGQSTEGTGQSRSQRRRRNKKEASSNASNPKSHTKQDNSAEDNEAGNSEDDEFAFLNQNRIVLKRASHVSIDSDSDEDD